MATESDQSFTADSTELSFVIDERDCANGQAPADRDVVPFVTETEDAVSIVMLVERVEGDATCPANPWSPITITLESPLGSRQLLDAHEFPPQPVGPVELRTDETADANILNPQVCVDLTESDGPILSGSVGWRRAKL